MRDPKWVSRALVEFIHEGVIEIGGGAQGLRDPALLESALARPQNLYAYGETDIFQLASSYAEAIARNHAFVDGNKRTAFFVASDFLELNGYELQSAVDKEHTDMMVELAQGNVTREEVAEHLRKHSTQL